MEKLTKEQIEQFRQHRLRECGEKIAAILREYEAALVGVPRLVDGRIVADVQLIDKL